MTVPDSMVELVADLDATKAYISDHVTERADSSDFEELVAMEDAVKQVAKACRDALSIISGEQVRQLEGAGSRMVGARTYIRVADTKQRFDHAAIARAIRERAHAAALNTDTGEINASEAVAQVAADMMALYVAPAVKPKTTVLKDMDIEPKAVSDREVTGYKIRVVDDGLSDDDE